MLYAHCDSWQIRELSALARRKQRSDQGHREGTINAASLAQRQLAHLLQHLDWLENTKTQCLGSGACLAG